MLALVVALLCVAANAFFVAAEFALAKVRGSSLQALADGGDLRARSALGVLARLDAYLGATQFGITLASLLLGWLGEPAIARFVEPPLTMLGAEEAVVHGVALGIAFTIITLLHIVIGELVPKSLAIQHPVRVVRWTVGPMRLFFALTYPAMLVLNGTSNLVLRLLRIPPASEGELTTDEVRVMIQAAFRGGHKVEQKRELIERVLRGTDRLVRAVMVPRVDMATLPSDASIVECLRAVREHGFSRYPVCEQDDPDRILGYVYVKDLLVADTETTSLRSLLREVGFVPETRTVGEVLTEFQRTRTPVAMVVDEYGGTSGLVTLEDVVEEIVGEIQDETDLEVPRVVVRVDGTIVVDGALPVDDLDVDGLELPPIEGADTFGGYIVAALGRLARPGDRVRLGHYEAVVEVVRGRRVARVSLRPVEEDP